ncbi:MAG: dihydrofolate reductase [Wenzhouxiangellaceae bacterium]
MTETPKRHIAPEIVLVAAVARNGVIGRDGGMPWHLPADLKRFRSLTMGHPVVMGRATFESIGKPLPGRRNIVVSRTWPRPPAGCELARSLDEAIDLAGAGPVMIIGGGQLYREAMPRAARMELTLIDAQPEGDTRFPEWSPDQWQLRAMEVLPGDETRSCRLVFCTLERVHNPCGSE